MGKIFLFALALAGFAVSARAGDLADDIKSMKDAIPEKLTWKGVTIYGTIDVGFAYLSNGAPLSGNQPQGLTYNISGARQADVTIVSIARNGMETSKIGAKLEEKLGDDWTLIGRMETAFSPLSGELDDGPGSLARNNSIPRIQNWTATSDSSRAGQALNGPVYGGMSHPTYGTLTIGRQQSLLLDAIGVYDPQSQAYAFSLIGWTAFFAGAGDSETARWDNSVKYIYEYGPFHAAGMYTQGGEDTGMFAGGYAFDIGGSYQGFSIDAIYTKERSAVSGATLSSCAVAAAIGFDCQRSLAGTISDNSAWSVQAKYSFEIGEGGFKDETPASKLTFYAGYENIIQGNPEDIVNAGERTMGGYVLATVNNSNFFTSRLNQIAWTGIKYEFLAGWRITGAYYYQDQNSFRTGVAGNTCFQQTAINTRNKAAGTFQGNPVAANCNGDVYSTSLVVDYQINKNFDVYGGVQYSDVSGGLSSGFLQDNQASVVTGTRLKF